MRVEDVANFVVTDVYWGHTVDTQSDRVGVWYMSQHPHWTLCFKYEGMTCYDLGDTRQISDASSVVLIPANQMYSYNCYSPGRMANVVFDIKEIPGLEPEILFINIQDKEKIFYGFQRVQDALHNGASNVEVLNYFYELFHMILRQSLKKPVTMMSGNNHKKVEPAENFIRQNYAQNITNEQLAKYCGFSTQYFRKLFTEVYEIPPMAYVSRVRLEAAVKLLKADDLLTIADVAEEVGFSDVYHFSKTFKKYTGVSPKKFAMQHRMGR